MIKLRLPPRLLCATGAATLACLTALPGQAAPRAAAVMHPTLAVPTSMEGVFRAHSYAIGGQTITIYVGPPEAAGGGQLALGLDNSLWYGINANPGGVMRFTPSTLKYRFSSSSSGLCDEYGVAEAANAKDMVFTVGCNSRYTFVSNAGVYTSFNTASGQSIGGNSLVLGPDGRIWSGYCCNSSGSVVAITSSGIATAYPLPSNEAVFGATVGPDKLIWYATNTGIGKITTDGKTATDFNPGFGTTGAIVSGADKRIWFSNAGAAEIGSISTAGTGLSLFTNGISATPHFMTLGPNKLIYFSEYNSSTGQAAIASISTTGTVKEYALPYGFNPNGIAVGPDMNIWVVDGAHDQLGELVLSTTAR